MTPKDPDAARRRRWRFETWAPAAGSIPAALVIGVQANWLIGAIAGLTSLSFCLVTSRLRIEYHRGYHVGRIDQMVDDEVRAISGARNPDPRTHDEPWSLPPTPVADMATAWARRRG